MGRGAFGGSTEHPLMDIQEIILLRDSEAVVRKWDWGSRWGRGIAIADGTGPVAGDPAIHDIIIIRLWHNRGMVTCLRRVQPKARRPKTKEGA